MMGSICPLEEKEDDSTKLARAYNLDRYIAGLCENLEPEFDNDVPLRKSNTKANPKFVSIINCDAIDSMVIGSSKPSNSHIQELMRCCSWR
jgi:hypothetical protein